MDGRSPGQNAPVCRARRPDGATCGHRATWFLADLGGWVCATHVPAPAEEPSRESHATRAGLARRPSLDVPAPHPRSA